MDERLQQLVGQIQEFTPGSVEQQQAIADFASQILKVRQIARTQPGQPLSPVQQAILEEAHQYLEQEIRLTIADINFRRITVQEWMQSLRSRAFQSVLTGSRLQQLAIAVQSLEAESPLRQAAMRELVQALHLSGKLTHPGRLPPDLYHEAVNETMIWMYRHIQTYDPRRGEFLGWINFRLNMIGREMAQKQRDPYVQSVQGRLIRTTYQLRSLVRQSEPRNLLYWIELNVRGLIINWAVGRAVMVLLSLVVLMKHHPLLIDKIAQAAVSGFPQLIQTEDSEYLETIPQPDHSSLSQILEQYITEDPRQILQQRCMRDRSDITLQIILQEHFIYDRPWKEISDIYQVAIPTLSNFYQRSIKSLAPEIRRAIQDEFEVG